VCHINREVYGPEFSIATNNAGTVAYLTQSIGRRLNYEAGASTATELALEEQSVYSANCQGVPGTGLDSGHEVQKSNFVWKVLFEIGFVEYVVLSITLSSV
jgi:hypothetical protein